jgi:hypothetical protein
MKHQQPQAPQRYRKSFWTPMQQHLPQYEIQRTGLSVQAPNLTNTDMLKTTNVVQQIFTELSEAVTEKYKIMVITKIVLNIIKQNGC